MAAGRKPSLARKSPQKKPVPEIQGSVRRSSRVRKSSIADAPSVPSTKLAENARSVHEPPSRSKGKSPVKHVSFVGKQTDDPETYHGGARNQQKQVEQEVDTQPRGIWSNQYVCQPTPSQSTSSVEPVSALYSHPHSTSMAPPARRQRVKSPVAADIIADAKKAMGIKRVRENMDNDQDDLDRHQRQKEGDSATHSYKRRKAHTTSPSSFPPRELPNVTILSRLRRHPRMLTLTQISLTLQLIQDLIFGTDDGSMRGFSERYFAFNLTDDQVAAWPLHELRTKYVSLYMTTRYVADGSQYGWRSFFTQPHSRPHLVSAILGEWFAQRIFKHTAFGFPQHLLDVLEDKDREYLHYDAVVRSKERAKIMKQCYEDRATERAILTTTIAMAENLAEELLTLLHPLLPPPIFDPTELDVSQSEQITGHRDSIQLVKEKQAHDLRAAIKHDLVNLIKDCAALHKSIRLTGDDGTIVRVVPSIEKGTQFQPTAPVRCVNRQFCNDTIPLDHSDPSQLCIKMTCWPRVEALVPEGPDMAELEFYEAEYRKELVLQEDAREIQASRAYGNHRHQRKPNAVPPSPTPSSSSFSSGSSAASYTASDVSSSSSDPDLGFHWQDKETLWPIVPRSLQDNEGLNAGKLDPATGELNTIKRAAYVSIYPTLCPAKVYCEWTPPPSTPAGTTSLDSAIHQARRTHAARIPLRLEDLQIDLWNAYATYGGLAQWGVLVAAAIYSISKYLQLPSHIASATLKLIRALKCPGARLTQIEPALADLWRSLGPFGPALAEPVKTLVFNPLSKMVDFATPTGSAARHESLQATRLEPSFASSKAERKSSDGLPHTLAAIVSSVSATVLTAARVGRGHARSSAPYNRPPPPPAVQPGVFSGGPIPVSAKLTGASVGAKTQTGTATVGRDAGEGQVST